MSEAVIVAYGRTPVCRAKKGSFALGHPIDFGAQALSGTLARVPQLNPEEIDDVVMGCACPAYELGYIIPRIIMHRAGLPDSIPGQVVNRFCSSGLQAIATCANAIVAEGEDVMVAGGIEFMSRLEQPHDPAYGNPWVLEHVPGAYLPMGITAENVAERYDVSRLAMEELAVESHRKAYAAQQSGDLNRAIIPITVTDPDGVEKVVSLDEGIRPNTTLEGLAELDPCFKEDGKVTAATSSQMSDGASFVILMSREKAEELEIRPIAKLTAYAVAGCDPEIMGVGPIYAVPKVMKKAGMTIQDMDVIELNEAFAAQAIPCIEKLKLPKDKLNPWGGAMALGHPMGATGGFLTSKALDYLQINGGKYALVTMCIGGGQGAAGIFELL